MFNEEKGSYKDIGKICQLKTFLYSLITTDIEWIWWNYTAFYYNLSHLYPIDNVFDEEKKEYRFHSSAAFQNPCRLNWNGLYLIPHIMEKIGGLQGMNGIIL